MCARMDVEWKFQNMTKDGLAWVGTSNTFASEKDPERLWNGLSPLPYRKCAYLRYFFFRMASFITSAFVLNHHGRVTVKANFAGDARRISVGNMRRISLGNMRRISVQNMRGNSIIPDMSFRPHLLNDLRSLENNRGMSKVENMFFFSL